MLRGRFGLRAGWSILLYTSLLTLCGSVFGIDPLGIVTCLEAGIRPIPTSHVITPDRDTALKPHEIQFHPVILGDGLTFVLAGSVTLALALMERRRMRVYGINRTNASDILPGAFWGLAALSLLVGTLHVMHALVFDARLLHGTAIFLFGAKWLFAFLLVGLTEEYLTRGFLQFTLMRGMMGLGRMLSAGHERAAAFWIAAVIMSIVFGALHLSNAGETPSGIAVVFFAGLLFSYALWRTGSLWWAIGFHTTWDWAQNFLWGVPDSGLVSAGRLFQTHPAGSLLFSGGSDGPEGSLLALPTLLLMAIVIRFTTRKGIQPPLEPERSFADEPVSIVA